MRPTRTRDITMLHIKNFFAKSVCKMMMVFAFIVVSCPATFADSEVYIFFPWKHFVPVPIKINNQEVFKMDGTRGGNRYVITYSPCKKKCVLKSEGKIIISNDFSYKLSDYSPSSAASIGDRTDHFASEIQLTLSENSVHYIQIINKYQFKEITEKEAQKLLKNKKIVQLPDYIEE